MPKREGFARVSRFYSQKGELLLQRAAKVRKYVRIHEVRFPLIHEGVSSYEGNTVGYIMSGSS